MALKLMYITNNPDVAKIAEANGVDRIFVDMEYIGKHLRQGGMDTVQSRHTVEDVKLIRNSVSTELIVRCNPIHEKTDEYLGSEEEIGAICRSKADVIMLPYFKTVEEVKKFVQYVDRRAKTMLLVETPEAVENIDEILEVDGIDEILIGLNDLSLGYKKKFMFEILAEGLVESLCEKFKQKNIPYGFGGIASLGKGMLPAEHIIAEHYRLGSTRVILSRSFCNPTLCKDLNEVQNIFENGMKELRAYEEFCVKQDSNFFDKNKETLREIVNKIVGK